tara:strand:- start:379 stop:603 length:225 start_codon:yes stop_codon:yes gene_type:complete
MERDTGSLSKSVNDHIRIGYKPIGGVGNYETKIFTSQHSETPQRRREFLTDEEEVVIWFTQAVLTTKSMLGDED